MLTAEQVESELVQLARLRSLLAGGGGRLSLVGPAEEIVVHPSPRLDLTNTWNGLPGL